jgi:polar amino acid transport system substrate-binding protein
VKPTNIRVCRLLAVVSLCVQLTVSSFAYGETLRMIAADWPPYVSRELPGNGAAIAIVTEALARGGYRAELRVDNWPRALEGIKLGVFDLVAGTWEDTQRETFLVYSDALMENEIVFVTLSERFIDYYELGDLQGLFIGVETDFAYQAGLLEHHDLIRVEHRHVIQNINGLLEGELDIIVTDRAAFMHAINSYLPGNRQRFRILEKPLEIKTLHLGISRQLKNYEQVLTDFNSRLEEMRNDGSHAAILKQYGFPVTVE